MEVFALSLKLKEEGAATVKAAVDKLRGSLDGVTKDATATDGAMKKLSLGAAAAGAAIGTTLVLGFKKMIDASVQAQFVAAQLEATLKSTGGAAGQTLGALNAHAAALQAVTIYDDDAIASSQALLLTFTKISGDTFPKATEAILNVATAMKTDLKSATVQVGKALNDPILGVTALARSGIQFSDAQKEVIKTLVETNRTAEAQALILKELETQFGGSARAARETLGGALMGLQNAWDNLFEVTASGTKPAAQAINALAASLTKFGENLSTIVTTAKAVAIALLAPFGARVVAAVNALIARIIAMNVAQRATIVAAQQEAAAALATARALTIKGASVRAVELAELRAAIATRNLTLQTSVMAQAMRVATGAASAMWAAIGGPIGAIVIAFAAATYALDKWDQRLDEADEKSANDPKYLAALEAVRKRRAAQEEAARKAEEAAQKAIAAVKEEAAALIELVKIGAASGAETARLTAHQRSLQEQLAAGNVPLVKRLELMNDLKNVEEALGAAADARMKRMAQASRTDISVERPADSLSAMTRGLGAGVTALDSKALAAIEKQGDLLRRTAQKAAMQVQTEMDQISNNLAEGIGGSLIDGISAGFEQAFASGKMSEGFKAMGETLLAGLGSAMIAFGRHAILFGKLMATIKKSLETLNPVAGIAAGVALVAIGSALRGAAARMFGGSTAASVGANGVTSSYTPSYASGPAPINRLTFGNTSATAAAGMTPRNTTNITVIGPNDPSAQRAIAELLRKAESRGSIG